MDEAIDRSSTVRIVAVSQPLPRTMLTGTIWSRRCRFEKHGTPFTIYVAPSLINGTTDLCGIWSRIS